MPYIITSRPGDTGPGAAFERLGQRVSEIGVASAKAIKEKKDEAARLRAEERKLDIEEVRAEATLAREKRQMALAEERAAERDADREESIQGLEQLGAKRARGLLGPYGSASGLGPKKRAKAAEAIQARLNENIKMAERMSPARAERFLKRETAALKQDILTAAYREEFEALQNAVQDGKFEDPFLTDQKAGAEPSPAAQQKIEQYSKAFKSGLKAGRPPGAITQRLEKDYALHAKLSARKDAWEEADATAKELLANIRQVANNAPTGIDPLTGADMRSDLIDRVADAAAEWHQTNAISFRRANDPNESLATLQKMLYGMQADANPDAFLESQLDEERRPVDMAAARAERGSVDRVRADAASGLGFAPGGSRSAAPRQERQEAAGPPQRGGLRGRQETGIQQFVATELGQIARKGGSAQEKADKLIQRVADQGYDIEDPEVQAAVEKALLAATQR